MATKDNIISLKVHVQKTDAFKVMRFASEMSISEVLKEIRTKLDDIQGGKDHGLFVPGNKETNKPGRWLEKNKTLKFYNLQNNVRCTR